MPLASIGTFFIQFFSSLLTLLLIGSPRSGHKTHLLLEVFSPFGHFLLIFFSSLFLLFT